MSSLGPDGTFLDDPTTRGVDGATDLSAAPLWAAFRDRYTRAKERRRSRDAEEEVSAEEPHQQREVAARHVEIRCCV